MMNIARFDTIPPHLPFLETLAASLLGNAGKDPLALARTLVLLPTRRSCRALADTFLRLSRGKPLLLPRIMALGELDEEADITLFAPIDLPAAMPEKRRFSMLTRLIMQAERLPPARAFALATDLARLLDDATKHHLNFEDLRELAPIELAAHWQKIVEFLTIITRQWPRILEAEGCIDRATFQREQLLALAAHWRVNPPDFPVIAAGSTGSQPATAALLHTIAAMPNGTVILPAYDTQMSDDVREMLEPTHPQWGMQALISSPIRGEVGRGASTASANNISSAQASPHLIPAFAGTPPMGEGINAIFSPAPLTAHWREEALNANDFAHIELMEADTELAEARMIAYKLREALDVPERTAALVTPNRTLARMVAAECARYDLNVDDSAGTPLAESACAVFMRLIIELVESGANPHALLALLRHPLASLGHDTADIRAASRTLEKHFLRGVRFTSGLDALVDMVENAAVSAELTALLHKLRDLLRPLELVFLQNNAVPLNTLIALHIACAEQLAGEQLWAKEAGETLAELLAGWSAESDTFGMIAPNDYPALFHALLATTVVRKKYGTHPRLAILSPLEGRLLHFDVVILGGMNEGTWPAAITPDPWMSLPMREAFGLPPASAHIGQSAHDVWMLMHAPQVILSRARKHFGKPEMPSRWWVRLTTLLEGHDKPLLTRMNISHAMEATIRAQDAPHAMTMLPRPVPIPPSAARPRSFRATDIDIWCSDPYVFYAKNMLRLRALDALDEEPNAAHFGTLIHAALEAFSKAHPDALPEHAYQLLIAHGQRVFQPYMNRPAVANLWWPRFEAIAKHFLAHEAALRAKENYSTMSEVNATWEFAAGDETVALKARADRVDMLANGFRLIDYKTGTPPNAKQVREGHAKQLPLTALALTESGTVSHTALSLAYWAMKTRDDSKNTVEVEASSELLTQTHEQLVQMITASLAGDTDYGASYAATIVDEHNDYTHLTRRSEWAG